MPTIETSAAYGELRSERWPYAERSSEHADVLADLLVRSPEFPLSNEEKDAAYVFENDLFDQDIIVSQEDDSKTKTLGEIMKQQKGVTSVAPTFFAEAFLQQGVTLEGAEMPVFTSSDDVYHWLATAIQDKTISNKDLRTLATASGMFYREKMTEALIAGEVPPLELTDRRELIIDPETFVRSASEALIARETLRTIRKEHKEGTIDHLDGAKRVITDIYVEKLNSAVAGNIQMISLLSRQADLLGDTDMAEVARSLLSSGFGEALQDETRRAAVLRRLDFLSNGMGLDASGNPTTVSRLIEPAAAETHEAAMEVPLFTAEEKQRLQEIMVEPDEVEALISAILDSAGMLSSEPAETWTPDRTERAADGRFQVIRNPVAASYAVNGQDGTYRIAPIPRSLYDVMTIACFHEVEHLGQAEADREIGKHFKLATLKGKGVSSLREGGANMRERAASMKWFGVAKPIVSLSYARGLQALERGGTVIDATEAFYKESQIESPEKPKAKLAAIAADRALRLVRGDFNSGSISYAEGGLFVRQLENAPQAVQQRAAAITSFSLADQLALHKYGLLESTDEPIDWSTHVEKVLMPYVRQKLREHE